MMNKFYFYCFALFMVPTFSAFGQTQPSQDENGYYLIENAEHLKWFRDQVNASEHKQVDPLFHGERRQGDGHASCLPSFLSCDTEERT